MLRCPVFLSHATKDKKIVSAIESMLTSQGFHPILIEREGVPGLFLNKEIQRRIDRSAFVVAVLTPRGARSTWVNQEIGYSIGRKKHVIPLMQIKVNPKFIAFLDPTIHIRYDPRRPKEALTKLLKSCETRRSKWRRKLKQRGVPHSSELTRSFAASEDLPVVLEHRIVQPHLPGASPRPFFFLKNRSQRDAYDLVISLPDWQSSIPFTLLAGHTYEDIDEFLENHAFTVLRTRRPGFEVIGNPPIMHPCKFRVSFTSAGKTWSAGWDLMLSYRTDGSVIVDSLAGPYHVPFSTESPKKKRESSLRAGGRWVRGSNSGHFEHGDEVPPHPV